MQQPENQPEKQQAWSQGVHLLAVEFEKKRNLKRDEAQSLVHFFFSQGFEHVETLRVLLSYSDRALGRDGLQALCDLMDPKVQDVVAFQKKMNAIISEASKGRKNAGTVGIRDLTQRVKRMKT